MTNFFSDCLLIRITLFDFLANLKTCLLLRPSVVISHLVHIQYLIGIVAHFQLRLKLKIVAFLGFKIILKRLEGYDDLQI